MTAVPADYLISLGNKMRKAANEDSDWNGYERVTEMVAVVKWLEVSCKVEWQRASGSKIFCIKTVHVQQ